MTAIRVEVTAEDIAACAVAPDVGEGFKSTHPESKDPVELAIGRATGQDVICDGGDADGSEVATIGARDSACTLVVDLPLEQAAWIDRYYKGQPVEPFSFDIPIDAWLVDVVRDEQPLLTLREAAERLGVVPATLRQLIDRETGSPTASRLRPVKLGRDWFVDRVAVDAEVARRLGQTT